MDTFRVLRGCVRIFYLIFGCQVRVAVAACTGAGKIEFENWGINMFNRSDIMGAVTIRASGGTERTRFPAHPVDAGIIFRGRILMTGCALGRRELFRVGKILDARMTIGALKGAVDRLSQGVGLDA